MSLLKELWDLGSRRAINIALLTELRLAKLHLPWATHLQWAAFLNV